ncbi:hypothetical protein PAXRUDRAFT_799064 [Paxillus rubicundulus Ve08.2h10]|uniref:Uncharacterized protein n=1 Tax=Paxillus rubicundulus Ve08.2h10 TaxID=930991 RepID=A0A0D0DXI9_9AGAM|nr:hypothetical protein PAXRUDRAFT_799064 [Paxillus rubicundulus Ve08.2h10]
MAIMLLYVHEPAIATHQCIQIMDIGSMVPGAAIPKIKTEAAAIHHNQRKNNPSTYLILLNRYQWKMSHGLVRYDGFDQPRRSYASSRWCSERHHYQAMEPLERGLHGNIAHRA